MKTFFVALLIGLFAGVRTDAAIINFDLIGSAGNGLLAGNTPTTGGTGGEIGAGITFNDVTSVLTVNVGWGSANGFTNLTSNVTDQHIHGPTASNYGNGYTQTAGVTFSLTRTSNSPSSGTIVNNTFTLTGAQKTNLYNGKYYINVHTVSNGGGEIRGFLVAVPQLSFTVTNAQANLTVSSVPGQKQIVQVSTNLPAWTPVVTNTTGTNVFQYTESNPQQFPARMYRAVVLP